VKNRFQNVLSNATCTATFRCLLASAAQQYLAPDDDIDPDAAFTEIKALLGGGSTYKPFYLSRETVLPIE
jgi:hypothetical protein